SDRLNFSGLSTRTAGFMRQKGTAMAICPFICRGSGSSGRSRFWSREAARKDELSTNSAPHLLTLGAKPCIMKLYGQSPPRRMGGQRHRRVKRHQERSDGKTETTVCCDPCVRRDRLLLRADPFQHGHPLGQRPGRAVHPGG